jgi:uncharacterized membrane protein
MLGSILSAMNEHAGEPLLFDAVLTPYRSLSPRGFAILMATAGLIGFAFGAGFVALGAWPIFGFCGAEWLLFYVCFRLNYRAARLQERIRLTPEVLTVERKDPRGRVQSWRFQPYWLRVEMDDPPEHESQLSLASHGKRLTIASFLSPPERYELALALRAALAGAKRGPGTSARAVG